MLNIVTLLKTGGEYDEEYLYRLYASIDNHISIPYRFYCLTDIEKINGINLIPIEGDGIKWWPKIEVFKHFISGSTLYMDLDTILVNDIDHMVKDNNHDFVALRGFYRDIFNSGFMFWNGDFSLIYENFLKVPKQEFKGKDKIDLHPLGNDQNFIYDELMEGGLIPEYWQDLFPGDIISYKVHIRDVKNYSEKKRNINSTSIVCFHGKPRPRDIGWKLIR